MDSEKEGRESWFILLSLIILFMNDRAESNPSCDRLNNGSPKMSRLEFLESVNVLPSIVKGTLQM